MSRETTQYGKYYWCVGLTRRSRKPGSEAKNVEVFVMADYVEVDPSGALQLVRSGVGDRPVNPNVIFAAGQWEFVYAASLIDGAAVAVEHWEGQIVESD